MHKSIPFIILLIFSYATLLSGQKKVQNDRSETFKIREALAIKNIFKGLEFENIDPTVFSGRVTDLAIDLNDPTHFYVAYASGGLWETKNIGTWFYPLFDQEYSMAIGAITCDWENNTLWVGTGEVNSSRSSYTGTGIFKCKDGGEYWGNKRNPYSEVSLPDFKVLAYAKTSGSMNYQILNESDVQLSEGILELNKGVQYIPIGLCLDKKGIKALKKNKNEGKEIPEPGDNGVHYLSAGNYTLYLSEGDNVFKKKPNH